MDKKPFLITTAIAYASKRPHIGNMYDHVCADMIARTKRMEGYDVFFLTGTDEHGQKIEEEAGKQGITPKQHVDNVSSIIRKDIDSLNVSYDKFIRTTDPEHEKTVQKIFKKLYEQGDIYKSEYEGWYCLPCESFFTEVQLKDGRCPDCGAEVRRAKEDAYFLRLSKYQKQLEEFLDAHPDFIQPESRKKEMINNFIKPGLQDLCVSRSSFKWGIPVDFDPKHVIYVWIDALSNYITGLGYDPDGNSSENYSKYWENCTHIIGKDILRFHSIYWIIELMALGAKLPEKIFAHPWLLFGEDKMSKSKGNVIYAEEMSGRFGADATRYYMLSEMPFAADGSMSYEAFIDRYNTDLANTLGNLVNRTVAMVNKYFGGTVHAPHEKTETDLDLEACCVEAAKNYIRHVDAFRLADATEDVIALARRANKYIDETSPWVLAKDEDKSRLETVMYELIEAIRFIGVLASPVMPATGEEIFKQINTDVKSFDSLSAFGGYAAGTNVGEAKPLFARIDSEKMLNELIAEMEAMKAKAAAEKAAKEAEENAEAAPLAPEIDIDEFFKADLRAGKIVSCEKVEKSKKLLRIRLEDGMGGRQVLSGIAKWYAPEDLVGKTVLFVANLKPAKLAGELSEGMICAADMPDGSAKVCFLDDGVPAGAKIR